MKRKIVAAALTAIGAVSAHAQELFQGPQQFLTDLQTVGVAVGDVNGDGLADVVASGCCGFQVPPKIYVYYQQADRTLNPHPFVYLPQFAGGSISIGDVTGDGRNDIVTQAFNAIVVIPQGSGGTLEPSISYPSVYNEQAKLGDLNGDGRLDVIGLEFSVDGHINTEEAGIFYQNPAGSFDPQVLVPLPHGFNDDVQVADINGDGRVDVIAVNAFNEPPITILYQSADGTLSAPVQLAIAPGVTAGHVGVADLNGDGRKDLAVTFGAFDEPNAHLAVFLQSADGSFAAPSIQDVATRLTALEVADANGDGRQDILLLHTLSIGILLQNADGSLAPETLLQIPQNAGGHYQGGFVAQDINGDGAVDLAYTQVGAQGAVTMYFGIPRVVNHPPVARNDRATLKCDASIVIPVLANDRDPDGDPLSVVAVSKPAHGTARVTEDGRRVKYDPQRRFRGTDRFTYTVSDGRGGTATATVTVVVK